MKAEGILVGTNKEQEWLLPWWWHHYSKENNYPVAFADFGMSEPAKAWCAERGVVFDVPQPIIAEKELRENPRVVKLLASPWIKNLEKSGKLKCEKFWDLRKVWFKKPVAFSLSPFQRTLWLDLDCEVRGNLEELFRLKLLESKFAARVDLQLYLDVGEPLIHINANTGVTLFEKDSPVVKHWVEELENGSRTAVTEEIVLASLLSRLQIRIFELPDEYNWSASLHGPNDKALIYHWIGEEGKEMIKKINEPPLAAIPALQG